VLHDGEAVENLGAIQAQEAVVLGGVGRARRGAVV